MEKLTAVLANNTRWWTGKKDFDYEASSSEQTKFKERVESIIQELQNNTEPETTDKAVLSVLHGLRFIFQLVLEDENFDKFGADALQTFQDAATTAQEPIRKYALLLTEVSAQLWINTYPMYKPANNDPSTDEVLDFIMGIYALERIGIAHDSKEEIRAVAKSFSVDDLFGYEYKVFRQPASSYKKLPMEWRDYTNALTYSFYAVKTGIDIHIDLSAVLKLLPAFRPYEDFATIDKDDNFDDYADQLTMVFNLIHVLSNYGEFQLSPSLLPLEFAFLSQDVHVHRAMHFNDVHLLGEILHCLRVFGVTEAVSTNMATGLAFLLQRQGADGSWPTRDDADDDYFRYHAAMCSISALYPRRFRGYGPCEVKLFRQLQMSKYATREGSKEPKGVAAADGVADLADFMQKRSVKVSGVDDVKVIRGLYEAQAQCVSHELPVSAEMYALCRLEELTEVRGRREARAKKARRSNTPREVGGVVKKARGRPRTAVKMELEAGKGAVEAADLLYPATEEVPTGL